MKKVLTLLVAVMLTLSSVAAYAASCSKDCKKSGCSKTEKKEGCCKGSEKSGCQKADPNSK